MSQMRWVGMNYCLARFIYEPIKKFWAERGNKQNQWMFFVSSFYRRLSSHSLSHPQDEDDDVEHFHIWILHKQEHSCWRWEFIVFESRRDENLQNHSLVLLAFDSITACQSKSFASSLITNSLRLDSETAVRIYRLVWVRKNKFDLTLSYVGLFRLWKRNQQTSKSTSWFRLDFNSFTRCLGRVTTLIDSWCDDSEWATIEFFFYGHFTSVN